MGDERSFALQLTGEYIASELGAARTVGDPAADALVSELIDSRDVDGFRGLSHTVNRLRPGQGFSQLPERLAEFLYEAGTPPPGWSGADARAAEGFFAHHRGEIAMLQRTVGVIGTYLSPTCAFTLRSISRPGGWEGPGRLARSSRLFSDMGKEGSLRDGTVASTATKARLMHALIRRTHRRSGEWDCAQWGEPLSRKYVGVAASTHSTQVLQAMGNLGIEVSRADADGFTCAWHYVSHFLGTPEKWLLPKNANEAEQLWIAQRDKEWQKTDDVVFMVQRAVDFSDKFLSPGRHDALIAMIRTGLTDKYADMAGLQLGPLGADDKRLAQDHRLISRNTKQTVGVDLSKEPFCGVLGAFDDPTSYELAYGEVTPCEEPDRRPVGA